MATEVTSFPAGDLTSGSLSGTGVDGEFGGIVFQPSSFSSPDVDEAGVSAEAGAMGGQAEGPATGPFQWPNAAQPGS